MKAKSLFLIFQATVLLMACSKSDSGGGSQPQATVPVLTTTAPTNITATSAQSGGTITSDGGSPVTARGVCWHVVTPTIANPKTTDGAGLGTFTSAITNLFPNDVYMVRAYATNSAGTGYGNEVIVYAQNPPTVPTVSTTSATNIRSTLAYTGGEVTATGNATVTDKGICWSTTPNPTIQTSNVISYGSGGLGTYTSAIFNLTVHTMYYVRAYATNSVGTAYGNEILFTTMYVIGDGLGGGRIFYLDGANQHGLIAAQTDQSGGARWNNTSNPYSNINAYSMADGVANTNAIIAAIGGSGFAASICRSYTGGGYTDWYLPSNNELYLLFLQRNIIGNFQNYFYWSSTASTSWNVNAWCFDFGAGYTDERDKTYLFFVRAIRAF